MPWREKPDPAHGRFLGSGYLLDTEMKLTNEEHMDLIAERCRELLAIAEKRTQGAWEKCGGFTPRYCAIKYSHGYVVFRMADYKEDFECGENVTAPYYEEQQANAQFIAACAGSAEAGWRAAIAAIELMKLTGYTTGHAAAQIIAAWPIELLRK